MATERFGRERRTQRAPVGDVTLLHELIDAVDIQTRYILRCTRCTCVHVNIDGVALLAHDAVRRGWTMTNGRVLCDTCSQNAAAPQAQAQAQAQAWRPEDTEEPEYAKEYEATRRRHVAEWPGSRTREWRHDESLSAGAAPPESEDEPDVQAMHIEEYVEPALSVEEERAMRDRFGLGQDRGEAV